MWPESDEQQKPLRTGLTTGTCATACAMAAASVLLRKNHSLSNVVITLPKGKEVELAVSVDATSSRIARASTIKDAGDDPDVTHGAKVYVELSLTDHPGIKFQAAEGVGTVTREGLVLEVGEPAINPVPRKMITEHLTKLSQFEHYHGGFNVAVGIENGEVIAQKTMNPKLGILGGLSILGTTGIVRPFSCAAWIASIHQGIDVAAANGIHHIAATTGNSSEQAIRDRYQLTDMALIEMGDFAGAVLKYLRKLDQSKVQTLQKLSLCGGFGKLTKLANGHMDLNSRASSIDFEHIALMAKSVGADEHLQSDIKQANTSVQALKMCQAKGIPLAEEVCRLAYQKARAYIPTSILVDIYAIDRQGAFVGQYMDELSEANQ